MGVHIALIISQDGTPNPRPIPSTQSGEGRGVRYRTSQSVLASGVLSAIFTEKVFTGNGLVPDDRGKQVAVLSLAQAKHDPQAEAIYRRVLGCSDPTKQGLGQSWPWAILILGFVLIWVLTFPTLIAKYKVPSWCIGAAYVAMAMTINRLRMMVMRRTFASRIVPSLLAQGYCPSCVYKLEACVPDGEWIVTCPECASAWAARRIPAMASDPLLHGRASSGMDDDSNAGGLVWLWRALHPTPTVIDDRQRVCKLVSVGSPRFVTQLSGSQIKHIEHVLSRKAMGTHIVFGLVFIVLFGTYFWLDIFTTIPPRTSLVFNFAILCLFGYSYFATRTRYAARHVRMVMLDARLCPSCAGDLSGTQPESDSTHRCPGCAAHWRLS